MIVVKPVVVLLEGINADLLKIQACEGNVATRISIGGLHTPRSFAAGLTTPSTSLKLSYTDLPR